MDLKVENDSKSLSDCENKSGETGMINGSSTEFASVPSFLMKTYEIVSNSEYKDIVKWSDEGDAFIILSNDFCDKILPTYFRHKNMSSFVRQLNIYGFKKSKSQNDEQCFSHKSFRRDNKRLLLEMKRNTKNSDKKVQNNDPFMRKSDVMKLMAQMNERIAGQENRIEKLVKSNKEFKNSVLALYTELEKSKEREKKMENILIELAPLSKIQFGANTILREDHADQLNEKPSTEGIFRLENSELLKLFRNFVETFIKNFGNNDLNNVIFDNRGNFSYFQRNAASNSRSLFPLDIQKVNYSNMLEHEPIRKKS